MNAEKYTQKALEAVKTAQNMAQENGNQYVTTEHLLYALLDQDGGLIGSLFGKMGVDCDGLLSELDTLIRNLPRISGGSGEVYASPEVGKILNLAEKTAEKLHDEYLSVEHLMLAIFSEGSQSVRQLLSNHGITRSRFSDELAKVKTSPVTSDNPEDSYDALKKYGTDLVERARTKELDPVIGRDAEIRNVIRILSRKTKNNPVLIGEPGVGKTAIAEGLAQRIAAGEVPFKLRSKEVYLLDLTALVAGTQFRGQFESRMKGLIDEVKKIGNIILVIDEVHNIVGAGDSEGSMNAANILKPALARGDIQVIGATTLKEYRKYIEKDAALERRFQPVYIGEPSVSETTEILKGIRSYYETFHGVTVSDEMCRRAAEMSERYITDRFLPDKAIDLIDEACSRLNLDSPQLSEIPELQNELERLQAQLDELTQSSARSEEEETYAKIASCRSRILQVEAQLHDLLCKPAPAVDEQLLAEVIEIWTGIPASKVAAQESARLRDMENRLKSHVIGQDEAVDAVCASIRRSRAGISPKRKPASFLFVGPTGVGKTELVKQLALDLFDSPDALVRLDMSEYMEKHTVSRLIGSPPGYVGYDEAGQLTEKIRRRPYSVVLFDEIEKAHPDVLNSLLQILDDGRLTDAQGRVVSFENTVIVMTSNAGSQSSSTPAGFGRTVSQMSRDRVMKALEEIMRPEFLNRIDEIIAFNQLTEDNFRLIAEIMLNELKGTLADKEIRLTWDDSLLALLVEKSYSVKYGARNLRRLIEKEIENPLANAIVTGDKPLLGAHLSAEDGRVKLDTI